jgi:hypothetical protein
MEIVVFEVGSIAMLIWHSVNGSWRSPSVGDGIYLLESWVLFDEPALFL